MACLWRRYTLSLKAAQVVSWDTPSHCHGELLRELSFFTGRGAVCLWLPVIIFFWSPWCPPLALEKIFDPPAPINEHLPYINNWGGVWMPRGEKKTWLYMNIVGVKLFESCIYDGIAPKAQKRLRKNVGPPPLWPSKNSGPPPLTTPKNSGPPTNKRPPPSKKW